MRTVNPLAVFALILLAAAPSHAQRNKAKTPTSNSNYVKDSFTAKDGTSIDYWVMAPEKIEQGRTYPLVLALHGRGGSTVAATELGSHTLRKEFPCFVIAPFSTADGHWALPADFGKRKKNTKAMLPAALEAMDAFMDSQPINPDRVYVTGQSMGGAGTFGALALRPDTFAAAIPVAGGWDPQDAAKMKKVAMWVFHGDQDKSVPTEYSRNMVDAIKKAGGMPKYTEYKGVGHNSWTRTYSASETWNWLFKQKRKQ
ncbi:MAG: prolyl oligopeptidase family serine peptidase [Rubripirellula sp.]|nr:prolyl oligopeptidase family serine peptidase [Rubripirellula sp.]